ncbi:MAG TPA: acyl-CoA dehydrogenase family protein [Pseudomonadales bacterium]|nr:acyl-CoA dehydrogenase family protein [Pseudomonadales bacterium]
MSAQLDPSELNAYRDTLVKFLENEVRPVFEQWERDGLMPREFWNVLGENGFLCVDIPEEYGGIGAPYAYAPLAVQESSRAGFGSLATGISVHSEIVAPYIWHLGTEEQKQYWLPKMVTGEAIGAIAMTEPGAGSDLQGMRTTAVKDGNEYVINGSKTFITNGQHADVVVLAVKTDPAAGAKGVTLFLVDAKTPGFSRGRKLEKMGLHSQDTSELFFDNMRVPESAVLGQVGRGFIHLMEELPRERLTIAVQALGAAEGALAATVAYVTERKAFGAPISALQNTRFKIAEMKTEIALNAAFIKECMAKYENRELDVPTAAMVKLASTEMQCRIIDECLQLHGGYGYMMEYPISRFYIDARIQRIYGGTSEVMKEVIARSVVGR